ncbi:Uncharacterised protein family UPF0755,YceG-like [Moorella glycerini]|uniref:YceG-like family protein n=1 Tax=Neomoorella stamsii TaxID=1266720 RepID=A0A9X7J1V0_9FIRM|nr:MULTISPECIES: hypothetical protein [Moorella]PRR72268.1 YceG-like family protein [Moorella stamsii]CEP68921.1 Uncharacterised protein family UPF0755,YceG-like [Moorella glycerini]CEP69569.1 Uncharacterised protein family UPF0755,YceG-like [Moorella glycerini]
MGFFLAGLLLLIFQHDPTREEIIARARTYGMVFREEVVPFAPASRDNAPPAQEMKQQPAGPQQAAPADTHGEILVTIPAGAGLEDIAALLEKKGVAAAASFEAEVHRQGVEQKLKAGSYYLPAGDIKEIIRRLTS